MRHRGKTYLKTTFTAYTTEDIPNYLNSWIASQRCSSSIVSSHFLSVFTQSAPVPRATRVKDTMGTPSTLTLGSVLHYLRRLIAAGFSFKT